MLRGAVFEILLHIGGGLAAQLILTVVQNFINGCPRRERTSGGTADDRVLVCVETATLIEVRKTRHSKNNWSPHHT